jgi:tRNA A37 N6-isopentenylltransferase MiaA
LKQIQKHLDLYKQTKGTPAEKQHIQQLKQLNNKKKALANELDQKVSGLYKDAELKVDEMTTSGAAGEYNTPFAFGKPESEKKKGKRQADLTGYTVVKESKTKKNK